MDAQGMFMSQSSLKTGMRAILDEEGVVHPLLRMGRQPSGTVGIATKP